MKTKTKKKIKIKNKILKSNFSFAEGSNRRAEQVDSFEARVGKKGHIRMKGSLPVAATLPSAGPVVPVKTEAPEKPADAPAQARLPARAGSLIGIELEGLDLRVRNVYTGAPPPILRREGTL